MKLSMSIGVAAMVVGFAVASCGPKKTNRAGGTDEPSVAGGPTQHWIYDDDLRSAMRDVERARQGVGEVADLEIPESALSEPTGDFKRVADSAAKLAASTEALSKSVDRFRLSAADRGAFTEQAQILQAQAVSLVRSARKQRVFDMRRHLDAITATCVTCHTRFRDFTGELAPPRV